MEKKYKLLKDLLEVKAGEVFVIHTNGLTDDDGYTWRNMYCPGGRYGSIFISGTYISRAPEWFEEDKVQYTESDMHGYALWLVRKFREQKEKALSPTRVGVPVDFLGDAELWTIEHWIENKNKKS